MNTVLPPASSGFLVANYLSAPRLWIVHQRS